MKIGIENPVLVEQNPPLSPFVRRGKERFPSLEKRGKGRFEGIKSTLVTIADLLI
jgi:hypothetical protein